MAFKIFHRKMLESLVEIQLMINKLEFEEMMEFIVCQIIEVLGVERCCIFRVFPETEIAYLIRGKPENEHGIGMKFSFSDLEALKEAAKSKSTVLIEDVWNDERTKNTRELIYFKKINAMLFVPVLVSDEVVAIITVDATDSKKTFTEEEKHFCLSLANSVGLLLERDLLHKEQEEKEILVILGRAAAEAAHRMRNPLVPIGGFARRIAKEVKDEKLKEYAEIIIKETGRLESVLEGILKFVRPRKVNVVLIDINEVIKEAIEITESLIKTKGKQINIERKLDSQIPSLLIDPLEIRDIFLDIIRNAVEAIEEEGTISIRSEKTEKFIKISVSNSGLIDEEVINHIFDPFFTTKPGSSGLGLASVVRTINAYEGELKVINDTQVRQTIFVIKLPYKSS